ncbi:SAM-dependent methyltransferase [Actinomadura harenae]|uniref:SAM-dependent methyltransferase n=1 Tax=Actinomadura harenae TaxID=2483351 RepID=A0A3M2LXJ3_9ACTN|nr:SAM-dependent methyltransferase [Actinomadura harenae]RMI42109.1 SAM-dependent methyltransferase [Actinomadura harenae]
MTVESLQANIASVQDYLLGGGDNYEVDRRWAEELVADHPYVREALWENREFLEAGIRYLAGDLGIGQFLDLGTGLPARRNVHEVAQECRPDARVVYVDKDHRVLIYARALLVGLPEGATHHVEADVCDPGAVLDGAAHILDFDRPVALVATAVLDYVEDPAAVLAPLLGALAPGSRLLLSHAVSGPAADDIARRYRDAFEVGVARTREVITRFVQPWSWDEHGLVDVAGWQAGVRVHAAGAAGQVSSTGLFAGGIACPPEPEVPLS